jgi:hypothetical protein
LTSLQPESQPWFEHTKRQEIVLKESTQEACVMGQQVKPGWGQSDWDKVHQARYADRSLIRECHQGQRVEHPAPTGRM